MDIKVGHRQDDPLAVLLPVSAVEGNQVADVGSSFLSCQFFHPLAEGIGDRNFVIAQRPLFESVGKDIVKAECPGARGIQGEDGCLELQHLVPPHLIELALDGFGIFCVAFPHRIRVSQQYLNEDVLQCHGLLTCNLGRIIPEIRNISEPLK